MKLKTIAVLSAGIALGATAGFAAGRGPFAGHPMLRKAANQLKGARRTLEGATHDAGGHREAAIKLVDQAIDEVKQAAEYADTHPAGGQPAAPPEAPPEGGPPEAPPGAGQ